MISTRRRFLALSFTLLAPAAAVAQDTNAQAIQITETGTHYVLTVPTSRLVLRLPKGNLVQAKAPTSGATNNPGYFHFTDQNAPYNISGWFEPQQGYAGAQKFWASEMAGRNKQLPPPRNVAFAKTGGWETITYDVTLAVGPGLTHTNVRAHWVQAGTWIDLHLSVTSVQTDSTQARAQLAARLAAISVSEKK